MLVTTVATDRYMPVHRLAHRRESSRATKPRDLARFNVEHRTSGLLTSIEDVVDVERCLLQSTVLRLVEKELQTSETVAEQFEFDFQTSKATESFDGILG